MTLESQSTAGRERPLRQQVLVLYLATSSLRSRVVSWSVYDGASYKEPDTGEDLEPPYRTGFDALCDGWRLLAASPLLPAYPGTEYLTSHHKFEFFFERLAPASPDGHSGVARPEASGARPPGVPGETGQAARTRPNGRDNLLSTEQVAEFVARGFLVFEALVPEEVNGVVVSELADERSGLRRRYPQGSPLNQCFSHYPGLSRMIGLPAVRGIVESLVRPGPDL